MTKITKAVGELPAETPTVVSDYKFYGAKKGSEVGFITRIDYDCNTYTLQSTHLLTNGNNWCLADSENLSHTINTLISNNWSVYEFETFKELMTWIIENDVDDESF